MLNEIIGKCPAIEKFKTALSYFAAQSAPLILIGEGGVGKYFFAAHIHSQSSLSKYPLESLNFQILSDRGKRIGLFGGEPPFITSNRRGILEFPGIVVLKHINHTDSYLQDKLAESLQRMKVSRFGSKDIRPINCRIIFTLRASPVDLLKKGLMTNSLFAALYTIKKFYIPPLRERREDIPPLAEYYLKKFYAGIVSKLNGQAPRIRGFDPNDRLEPHFSEFLQNQVWEDNVRDVIAYLRNLLVFPYEEEILQMEKLEIMKMLTMVEEGNEFSLPESLMKIERGIVRRALKKFNDHQVKAAVLLGITDRAIRRKINN